MKINIAAPSPDPASNMEEIRGRIDAAAKLSISQPPQEVSIVAVSKRQPVSKIEALLRAGHRIFGESRVQEAAQKWPNLRERTPDVELHMVGPLQTNKVAEAVALFDVIHSLDRLKLASKLGAEVSKTGRNVRCFVQVNTGEEEQKSGVMPSKVDDFILQCRLTYGLDVVGLMCIPPFDEEPALHFSLLSGIAKRNELSVLSMGMSRDFETAVQFGATHIRIGTALFGLRET